MVTIFLNSMICANSTDQILNEIKQLRIDMNKRFDTVFSILYILMGLVFASPFIAIYLRDKKEVQEKKLFDNIKAMLFVFREQALDDPKLSRSLKAAGLL